jgi:hypothetical protein
VKNYGVIIVTRDRLQTIAKTVPRWLEQDLPILLLTEPNQVGKIRELFGNTKRVRVAGHPKRDMGVGYARMRAVQYAHHLGMDAFIMADDDVVISKGNVRCLLDFVAAKKAIVCGGWMPNYGLWVPDGNAISKEPDLVIPCGGARDRVFALNTELSLAVGNFHPKLKTLDTQEMNRLGIKNGHLWYIHSGCHINMINKPHADGGIQAVFKTPEERSAQNKRDHEIVYKIWGPRYISDPSKRMATRWLKMAEDFIGKRAVDAMRSSQTFHAKQVRPAKRMFGGS